MDKEAGAGWSMVAPVGAGFELNKLKHTKWQLTGSEMLYERLLDTLNLILLPAVVDELSYITEVEENLRELEGDYYTFLNKINLQNLFDNALISAHLVILLDEIWKDIEAINPKLWNPKDFISNPEWIAIRGKAKIVLAAL